MRITDDFERASIGANYALASTVTFSIYDSGPNNWLAKDIGGGSTAVLEYVGATFGPDQRASIEQPISRPESNLGNVGTLVRLTVNDIDDFDGYLGAGHTGDGEGARILSRFDAGVRTDLVVDSTNNGHGVGVATDCQIIGTTLSSRIDGANEISTTDNTYASGSVGVCIICTGTLYGDNFIAEDFAGGLLKRRQNVAECKLW